MRVRVYLDDGTSVDVEPRERIVALPQDGYWNQLRAVCVGTDYKVLPDDWLVVLETYQVQNLRTDSEDEWFSIEGNSHAPRFKDEEVARFRPATWVRVQKV